MMLDLILLIAIFLVILAMCFIKPKCPKCGGKMKDVTIDNDKLVYKCDDCGEEWI